MRYDMHPIEPEELMAYLDGELAPGRASEAAQHLTDCRECQAAVAETQEMSRKLQHWQVEEAGPRVEQGIRSESRLPKNRRLWRRRMRWVVAVAATCAIGVMFIPARKTAPGAAVRVRMHELGQMGSETASVDLANTRSPLIIQTAQMTLTATDFSKVRTALEEILKRHGGYLGNLVLNAPADSGQSLEATLRVPTAQLDDTLTEIRGLGRVQREQRGGEEVTDQVIDLEARLANARKTEERLSGILRTSAGKMTDILAVEKEIDRVRDEVEKLEARRKNIGQRISFATIEVNIQEEYKAHIATAEPSVGRRLRNAGIEGYHNATSSVTGIAIFLLSYGPPMLLWGVLLFVPARYAWRRFYRA